MKKQTLLLALALTSLSYEAFTAEVVYRAANDYSSISSPMKMESTSVSPTGVRVFTSTASKGSVNYKFQLDQDSDFQIEAYVLSDSTSRNALGVSVDGSSAVTWDMDVNAAYEWKKFPTVYNGKAGVIALKLTGIDAYTRIAAVRLTKVESAFAVNYVPPVIFNEGQPANIVFNKISGKAGKITYKILRGRSYEQIFSEKVTFTESDKTITVPVTIPDDNLYDPIEDRIKIQVTGNTSVFVPYKDNDETTSTPVTVQGLRIVSEPSAVHFGKKLSNVLVEMIDSKGNRVESSSEVVTVKLKEAGILNGTKSVAMVKGLATFSNLTVTNGNLANKLSFKAGSYGLDSENIEFSDYSIIDSDAVIATTLNATNFANAVSLAKTAAPGTKILVPNETITNSSVLGAKDAHYSISANGSAGNPVVIEPLNAGGVLFKGTSKVKISGKYVVFKGFKFQDIDPMGGYGGDLSIIKIDSCDHCAVRGITMTGGPLYSVASGSDEDSKHYKSILIAPTASYAEVSDSTFIGKRNAGSVILINRDMNSLLPNGHRIYRNEFLDRTIGNNGLNDFDIIRIGDSKASLSPERNVLDAAASDVMFGSTIENNLFENYNLLPALVASCTASNGWSTDACSSEPEVISVKSPQNIIRFNTFRNINGGLTLRHGFQNIVEGNYFFGGAVEGSYGVRLIGDTQVVSSNHMQDLRTQTGAKFKGAISLISAQPEGRAINGYWPVYDSVMAFNFMAHNRRNFFMSANYSSSAPVLPERNLASYNFVAALSSSSESIVKNTTPSSNTRPLNELLLFQSSAYDQGTLGWSVTSGWTQLSNPLELNVLDEVKAPLMTSSQGIYDNLKVTEAKLSALKSSQGAIPNVPAAQKVRLGKLIDLLQIRDGNIYESIPALSRGDVGSM